MSNRNGKDDEIIWSHPYGMLLSKTCPHFDRMLINISWKYPLQLIFSVIICVVIEARS